MKSTASSSNVEISAQPPSPMSSVFYLAGLAVALLVALGLRLWDISADLPAYFARGSQDLTTDAAYLTLYAKTAVQYGTWNLFGFEPWSAFQVSVISGVSYLLFVLGGVSRATAALAGTLLQLVGLGFFVAGCSRLLRRETVLVIAALLASNYLLVLFGRVPFSEDGLIFFAGVAFWVYARWFEADWGKVAVGLLVASGALFGKSFGFLIAGGPALALLVRGERKLRQLVLLAMPMIALTVLYALVSRSKGGFFSFLYEFGVGEHGSPHGFSSVAALIASLVSVSRTGLHQYTPALSLFVYLAIVISLLAKLDLGSKGKLFYYMVGWIAVWLVVLSPFNYHPVRYLFILTIPMTIVLGVVLERSRDGALAFGRRWSWWRTLIVFAVTWYAVFSFLIALFAKSLADEIVIHYVQVALPISAVITVLLVVLFLMVKKLRIIVPAIMIAAIGACIVVTDGWQFYSWFVHRTHMIEEAAQAIKEVVGPGAVFGGQAGPTLASNAPIGSIRLFLRDDIGAFERSLQQYPVTHVAISVASYTADLDKSAVLKRSPIIATFWLRDNYIVLLRVSSASGNNQAAQYRPSAYEAAVEMENAGNLAQAEQVMARFLAEHPRHKMALIEEYYLITRVKKPSDAQAVIDTLGKYYSTDYTVDLIAAVYYRFMADKTGDAAATMKARAYYEKALWYGPLVKDETERMYNKLTPQDRIAQ